MELPAVGSFISSITTFFLIFSQNALSFYLPGDAPQDFRKGDSLNVKVSKLTSVKTQLPYSYYSLHFCRPPTIFDSPANLEKVLHLENNSPYVFKMREPRTCVIVCRLILYSQDAKDLKEKIEDGYRVNMILDNLPLVVRTAQEAGAAPVYQLGFHVGLKGQHNGSKEIRYFIHNHLSFTVKYHKDEQQSDLSRIVGFEVTPSSVKHEYEGLWTSRLSTCDPHAQPTVTSSNSPQEVEDKKEIIFTYDVSFQESKVEWSSRWDEYLSMADDQIRWYSIMNSLMIVLFLSAMVATVMLRTILRDISKYNEQVGTTEDWAREENGWKSLHADVFRPPTNSDLLCVHVGIGVHLLGMTLATIAFAVLGFLSPSSRGGLLMAMQLLYAFTGIFAGYTAARLYKAFDGIEWRRFTLKISFLFPGSTLCIFFALDGLVSGRNSFRAMLPLGAVLALVVSWFVVSIPLVFLGSYLGYKKPAIEDPVKTGEIPRQIPGRAWYVSPGLTILIGGILPFSAVYVELFYILTSVWLNRYHYLFAFLFVVLAVLAMTCAEVSVVLCYFQLRSGDYRWWWRSYLTSGSSVFYLFLYAIFYFFTRLHAAKLVHFGYVLIASYAFFAVMGVVGFYACFSFTRLIYSSVKID